MSHLVLVFFLHLLHLALLAALVLVIGAPTLVLAPLIFSGLLLLFDLLPSLAPLPLALVLLRADLLRLRLSPRVRAERDRHLDSYKYFDETDSKFRPLEMFKRSECSIF